MRNIGRVNSELVKKINKLIEKNERDEAKELMPEVAPLVLFSKQGACIDETNCLDQIRDIREMEAETIRFEEWIAQDNGSNYLDDLFFEGKR